MHLEDADEWRDLIKSNDKEKAQNFAEIWNSLEVDPNLAISIQKEIEQVWTRQNILYVN